MNNNQHGIIGWFASNPVAANLLLLSVIILGLISLGGLRKEAFPMMEAEAINIVVNYDSGDAAAVEEGIVIKVEEALATVAGIKRITSTSTTNAASIRVEKSGDYDLDVLLRDIKSNVDAIYNFPADAEKPVINIERQLEHAYSIVIAGDADQATLQELGQQLKSDLLILPGISNISFSGYAEPMISIEIDESRLASYGLTLSEVSELINQESGTALTTSLRNADKVVRLKASDQAYYLKEFDNIPLVTGDDGALIRLGDVATITDSYADDRLVLARYNGKKGLGLEIRVDEGGDVIDIVGKVNQVIEQWRASGNLPQGIEISSWDDGSEMITDRLSLLIKNALTGIALVFIVLALFLNLRVAIWVAAGLPFVFCGTLFFMTDDFTGMSINELTTFGFILALGIVVDDAVVVGESIYTTRREEGDTLENTIKGTKRVAVPTIFGVLTTVATFVALSNVSGGMGQVYSQFAVIVTLCLLLSVVESKLILPSHLAHLNTHRKVGTGWKDSWARIQHAADTGLNTFSQRIYQPLVDRILEYRYAAVAGFIALFILVIGMPFNGAVRVGFFPDIPGSVLATSMTMQTDASYGQTLENLNHIEQAALQTDRQLSAADPDYGKRSAINVIEVVASDDLSAGVTVELEKDAPYSMKEFAGIWQEKIGNPEGVKKLRVISGFDMGDNFKVELKAWDHSTLQSAGEAFREYLSGISGVMSVDDNYDTGQAQLRFELNEQGFALGLDTAALSRHLLQAFGGEVVQRFQRGKDEVTVRVRYPESERQTTEDVMTSLISTPSGMNVPLSSVAHVVSDFQQQSLTRISGKPAVYVSADVDKDVLSANELVSGLREQLVPELKAQYPDLVIHFAGEAERQAETSGSMANLFVVALLAIYILLAVPLKSYVQPLIIMTAIPFGFIGAILGHWANDMLLSVLSFNGIVALSGVVVNDSLLLTSRFNDLVAQGIPVRKAVQGACRDRLRAVLLTSVTTYAGLMPLLGETSTQAQFIIPAAASLGYGILFATFITLLLIPALLLIHHEVKQKLHEYWSGLVTKANIQSDAS